MKKGLESEEDYVDTTSDKHIRKAYYWLKVAILIGSIAGIVCIIVYVAGTVEAIGAFAISHGLLLLAAVAFAAFLAWLLLNAVCGALFDLKRIRSLLEKPSEDGAVTKDEGASENGEA